MPNVLTVSTDTLRKFDFPGFESNAPESKKPYERKGALSKIPPTPLSILNSKPVRNIFNDKGEAIGEEDIEVIDLMKETNKMHIGGKRVGEDGESEGASKKGKLFE